MTNIIFESLKKQQKQPSLYYFIDIVNNLNLKFKI